MGGTMSTVFATSTMSLDRYVSGPNQRLDAPFGDGSAEHLHRWMFEQPGGNAAEIAAIVEAGAFIMGRKMFSSATGPWDPEWRGWWGDDPPFHAPVFVL